MPGVQICRFSLPEPEQEPLQSVPVCGAPLQFEVLFCLTGRLTVRALQGTSCTVEAPGIFLLSDSSALRSCQYSGNLGGILIAVDAKAAKESLVTVCSTLGMRLDTRIVKEKMTARNGCMALCGTPWTQSFFETVRYLSEQEQERYCVFKSVELLYLLCTEAFESDESPSGGSCPVPPQSLGSQGIHPDAPVRKAHHCVPLQTVFPFPDLLERRVPPRLWHADSQLFWFNSASDGHRS